MKLATIVLAGLLLAASAGVAFAHGGSDDETEGSSVLGPVQSATIAVVDMKVPAYEAARQAVSSAALAQGAKLEDLHTWVDDKGRKHGWIRFSLPADRMPATLGPIYAVGKLYSEKMTSSDYKSDSDQLARRIASLTRHEGRLDSLLNSHRRLRGSDLLYIQERVFRADVDAGMLDQQRIDMQGAQGMASLQVELFEPGTLPVKPLTRVNLKSWYLAALSRAGTEANRQLARGATASAYVLVYAPLWIPILIVGLVALWLIWRLLRKLIPHLPRIMAFLLRPIGNRLGFTSPDE
ncbi:MAG TPA: DUF4349 domain-containing protein [Capsulimonadaceae bacterium]|nr:DUF4349 domain-containing protein [Capsulimonadaceae bacterium]